MNISNDYNYIYFLFFLIIINTSFEVINFIDFSISYNVNLYNLLNRRFKIMRINLSQKEVCHLNKIYKTSTLSCDFARLTSNFYMSMKVESLLACTGIKSHKIRAYENSLFKYKIFSN